MIDTKAGNVGKAPLEIRLTASYTDIAWTNVQTSVRRVRDTFRAENTNRLNLTYWFPNQAG